MKKKILFKSLLLLLFTISLNAQQAVYYVNQKSGLDTNDGLTSTTPLKTIDNIPKTVADNGNTAFQIILMGEFANNSYDASYSYSASDDTILWNAENTISFNNFKGEVGKYITIKSHDSNTILKGNGNNIFRVQNSEYLIIQDLEIKGEVSNIPLATANALQFAYLNRTTDPSIDPLNPTLAQIRQRDEDDCVVANCANGTDSDGDLTDIDDDTTVRPSYIDTRGLYLTDVNNIIIKNNKIHDMPGGGLRVSDCEDIEILDNEVTQCSLRSYSGTHGLVVTKATSSRTSTVGKTADNDYRIQIVRNKIHNNYNEQYSWSPDKTKITPHIDEGKGISLQRNKTTYEADGTTIKVNWENGRILVANNLAYYNGFSGIHSNDGDRIDFINNTSYFNSYTKSITEDDDGDPNTFPTDNNGGNIGISMSDGFDCKIINNISVIDSRLSKSAVSVKNGTISTSDATSATRNAGTPDAEISNNLIYGTTLQGVTSSINENVTTSGIQENSIKLDPLFVDPLNGDFRLKITSPAINSADNDEAPSTDYSENSRFGTADRGALEFDANVTLWEGNTSKTWTDASNWSAGVPVDNTYAINIPTGLPNYPGITTANVALKDVYINSGGTLAINPTGSLTIERDLTQDGTFTIKSDATNSGSLVLKGENKGTANTDYERYVTTNWTLISSPVKNHAINSFKNDVIKKDEKYALAPYQNNLDDELRYNYYTDNTGLNDIDLVGNFNVAKGYSIKKTTTGILSFSGKIQTEDSPIVLTDGVSGAVGNKWNLIGNPSTAYIALNNTADALNNILTINASKLDPSRVAIYMWNGTSYDILNHSSGVAKYAAPGQGFFVESINGGETLSITEAMQSNQTGQSFFKTQNTIPEITLSISSDNVTKNTQIKYFENTTTGLDLGYDAGTFSANSTNFNVFTHLVSDSEGVDFALQCLPNSDYENMIIPVGITAEKDSEIKFSAETLNLPNGILVYLEDKENNKFTELSTINKEYRVKLNDVENGIGRFYLHTSSRSLSVDDAQLQNVNIYTLDNSILRITGFDSEKATLKVYDVLGKKVLNKILEQKTINDIELPNLKTGIYIVNVKSNSRNTSKKIILN